MDRFSKTHPLFQFLFFGFVFVLTLSAYNPFFSAISLFGAVIYALVLRGKSSFSALKFVSAIIFFVGIFNMLFAHYGESVMFTIGDTEFTREALLYGLNQGVVLASVVIWFASFSRIMESEKVVYALRFMPKTALIFSMVLSFIPRFTKKLEDIRIARQGLYGSKKPKGVKERLRSGIDTFSALVTYSLESSIITSNSMRSRGYNPRAIRNTRYKIKPYDVVAIALSTLLFAYVLYSKISGKMVFVFEPTTYIQSIDFVGLICFGVLSLMPVIIDLVEVLIWKLSSVKN